MWGISKRTVVAMALSLLATGCAVKPQALGDTATLAGPGSEHAGQATMYFLRDETRMGAIYSLDVKVDGVSKGSVRRETYIQFPVPPGQHTLLASWPLIAGFPDIAVEGAFEADKTYYFLFSTNYTGNTFEVRMGQVPPDAGKGLVQRYSRR